MQTKEIKEVIELMLKYKVAKFSIGNLSVEFSPESSRVQIEKTEEVSEEQQIIEDRELEKKRIEDEQKQFEEDNYYST